MNIVLFEFKSHFKSLISWTIAIFLISLLFISFYPMLKGDMDAFSNIMSNYPVAIQKMFGFDPGLLKNALGYYASFAFTFILLFASIFSSILGFSILSKDLVKKSSEFLYTKPMKREKIVLFKFLSGISLLVSFNICIIILNFIALSLVSTFDITAYLLVTLVLLFVQLALYSLSLIASLFMKVKSPIASALALTFTMYGGSVALSNDFRALIPFKYFNMLDIVSNKRYDFEYLLLVFGLLLISLISSIYVFRKKDL